jgi:intracellular septation protein A
MVDCSLLKVPSGKTAMDVLFMTVIFGGITLMLSDDFYIRLKAVILNLIFAGAFLLSDVQQR